MTKQQAYVLRSAPSDLDLHFYRRYDPGFLFNKALALSYAAKDASLFKEKLEAFAGLQDYINANEDYIGDRFFDSLRAELHFTESHQFEAFFALLIAIFQDKPHWIYLTEYTTKEIKTAVESFLSGDISKLTNGHLDNETDFIIHALYLGHSPMDDEVRNRWDENVDTISWFLHRMAKRYLDASEYNAYKHGLRVMTGRHSFQFSLQGADAEQGMPVFGRASNDSVSFLRLEDIGEGGKTVHEVTKHFNPDESLYYLAIMHSMIQTLVSIRLAKIKGDEEASAKLFLDIDKVHALSLGANNTEMTVTR